MSVKNQYFAARDPQSLVKHLEGFHQSWQAVVGSASDYGLAAVWQRNVRAYYSTLFEGEGADSSLGYSGDMGEIVRMKVPQARSLNRQILSLTTKQKLHFEPQAESSDSKTIASTSMGSAIISLTQREQRIDNKAHLMAEIGSLMGASYIYTRWNPLKGRRVGVNPETGEVIFSGALGMAILSYYDLRFDYTQPDFSEQPWVEVRTLANRFDLIAKCPHLEAALLKVPSAAAGRGSAAMWQEQISDDMIWIWEFYHRSSPAIEEGRYLAYASKDAIFFDVENPNKDPDGQAYLPIAEFRPEPIVGTAFAYPIYSNILPLQEMLDHNFCAQATNNAAGAVRSIVNPAGNDINVKHIGGMKFITYKPLQGLQGGGKPEVLDLNAPNTESYRFSEVIMANMQQVYNLNSAIRGEPPAGVTAASAIATLSTNAIEFSQSFTNAYVEALETALTHAIWAYANFGDEEMLVAAIGPNDASIARQFKRDALKPIKRVKAQIANPLMATAAGKLEVAQNLLANGMIKSPNKYFQILEGAPVKGLYEKEFNQEQFIGEENEELRKSVDEQPIAVHALATDDHPAHMQAHASLLDSLEIRNDPERRARIEDHIAHHYQLAMDTDPALAQMIKTGTMPELPPPMPGGPAPGPQGPGPMGDPAQPAGPAEPAEPLATIESPDMGGLAPNLPV